MKSEIEIKDEFVKRLEQENKDKERELEIKVTEIRQQEFDKRCTVEQEKYGFGY